MGQQAETRVGRHEQHIVLHHPADRGIVVAAFLPVPQHVEQTDDADEVVRIVDHRERAEPQVGHPLHCGGYRVVRANSDDTTGHDIPGTQRHVRKVT